MENDGKRVSESERGDGLNFGVFLVIFCELNS